MGSWYGQLTAAGVEIEAPAGGRLRVGSVPAGRGSRTGTRGGRRGWNLKEAPELERRVFQFRPQAAFSRLTKAAHQQEVRAKALRDGVHSQGRGHQRHINGKAPVEARTTNASTTQRH